MKYLTKIIALTTLILLCFLSGCGQTGPLYLPPADAPQATQK